MFKFKCATCDEWHEGMPSFGAAAPSPYYKIPSEEREDRCQLSSDACIIDDREFMIRGCIDIPVSGTDSHFTWGVWVSTDFQYFKKFLLLFDEADRDQFGPYFGRLASRIDGYPETEGLSCRLYMRNNGIRPYIEIEPADHPLTIEQRDGITVERVAEIYAMYMH